MKKFLAKIAMIAMVISPLAAPMTAEAATTWDVSGTYVWDVFGTYFHDITLVQASDGTFTGTGSWPSGGPEQTGEIITGTVTDDSIAFTVTYTGPYGAGSVFNMTGSIDGSGYISGTSPWDWQFTGGLAEKIVTNTTVVVTPANMQGWGFLQETPTGSGGMELGPSTPPAGIGSAKLVVDSTGGEILGVAYSGTRLDEITKLEYSTFRTSGGPALAIALQLNFDSDITDANDAWQGRLVYEPYHTQTVNTGVWETWNTLNDAAGSATGNWWFSNGTHAANSGCTMANPCTWAEVLTKFPNGGIHNTLGALNLKAGGGWTGGFVGNVDALTIGVNYANTTYDFEVYPRSAEITAPLSGVEVSGSVSFTAYLNDDDVDAIQWAIRKGTCAAGVGTVFGNVDTLIDVAVINVDDLSNQTFSFIGDMSEMDPGIYCFVYNPIEDSGESNIRLTSEFVLVAPPVIPTIPTTADECKKGGWTTLADDEGNTFKNQGDCVSYVVTDGKNLGSIE